ncbi:peptidylprolyl isomerase [soil metagenome]
MITLNRFAFIIFCFFAISSTNNLLAQPPVEGDKILAVVGNDIILESDFQYQLQLYARQNNLTQLNPQIAQSVFQSMLSDKIILAKAEQDSIDVTEDEVNKELDQRVRSLQAQLGSDQKLEEVYGMSLVKIRILLKDDLRKKLRSDKLKRQKFGNGLKVSDKEVKAFYETYKDSIPKSSDEFEVSHIFIYRKISDVEKKIARDRAQIILDSLKNGADFSTLAKHNSEDSVSALAGGNLGTAKKGSFVKPFEEAALLLQPGQYTDLVETLYGYHIIKLLDKKGDSFTTQHILIKFPKLESSDMESISFLNDVKSRITSGQITFSEAVKLYSQDEESKDKDGYLGVLSGDQLDPIVIEELKKTPEGGITDPVRVGNDLNYGYEIVKVIRKSDAHSLTLDSDYEKIKRIAQNYKENKEFASWMDELKKDIYVDIRY